jgi:TonB family protein
VIHFDIEDRYQDENVVGRAINTRDGVLLSVVFHSLIAAALIIGPTLPVFQPTPEELAQQQAELERQQEAARQRMVFVEPPVDTPALRPPELAELSDIDRQAQDPVATREAENPLPFSRGDSSERVIATEDERARGSGDPDQPPQPQPESQMARVTPPSENATRRAADTTVPRVGGALGDALKNLQRYVQNETFNNPQGGNDRPGATIQFDTRGVEFGPWLRRFVAQVRSKWFIPQAAMVMSGHVVLQFNIHRSGEISDVRIVQPSSIDAFNNAAYGAIVTSNPTAPLPPEYPLDKALFTVTFYYNEEPPN